MVPGTRHSNLQVPDGTVVPLNVSCGKIENHSPSYCGGQWYLLIFKCASWQVAKQLQEPF